LQWQRCLRLSFRRRRYRGLWFMAPCHRKFFYVQLTDWRGSHSVNRTWLVTAFFFALLLLILYGAFLILTPFLTAITWAAILAILFYPVYAGLFELCTGARRSQR